MKLSTVFLRDENLTNTTTETILQAKAWGATAPIVKEAVKRF
jgi:hypothetical protein